MLRSAVERQFEIIGEALAQALRIAPDLASRISDTGRIIAFRNRLIHGRTSIADDIVWGFLSPVYPICIVKEPPYYGRRECSLLSPLVAVLASAVYSEFLGKKGSKIFLRREGACQRRNPSGWTFHEVATLWSDFPSQEIRPIISPQ